MNTIPIPARAPATNGQNAVVIFDYAELDVVFGCRAGALRRWVIFHCAAIYQCFDIFTTWDSAT
jgi:hypothetical protein